MSRAQKIAIGIASVIQAFIAITIVVTLVLVFGGI
jgi:hypothetical protein